MSTKKTTKDKHGNLVREGDAVRVLTVESSFIENLPADEQDDIRSMIGKEYEVEEIDEYGSAWVTQWWNRGEGQKESHSLALAPDEMELVSQGTS